MNVLIFGSGAVGLGIASCLLKSGVQTTLVAGLETVEALNYGGLIRTGIFGDFTAKTDSFTAVSKLEELSEAAFDFVMVCTKSIQTEIAAAEINQHRHLLKLGAKIIHCQNGWGNAEKFLAYFDKEIVYSGRVITGFTRPERNHVEITVHADAVHIGSLFGASLEPVKEICEAINDGGLPCIPWEAIENDLWAKMLYNCALNPLGAILDVPYGELGEQESSRKIMNTIIDEVFAVMAAAGFSTYASNAEEYKQTFYEKLLPPTALHRSSTLQDIKAGRKTEIKALTGQVIAIGRKCGIKVPTNQTVYDMIRFVEAQNVST
jgi:2-dehydropantoate 2-reductase